MRAEERQQKAGLKPELKRAEKKSERGRFWATHWISSRSKRDGLHVMVGDNLWRKTNRTTGEKEKKRKTHG